MTPRYEHQWLAGTVLLFAGCASSADNTIEHGADKEGPGDKTPFQVCMDKMNAFLVSPGAPSTFGIAGCEEKKDPTACRSVAQMFVAENSPHDETCARTVFRVACLDGSGEACRDLAAYEYAAGGPRNTQGALLAARKGCDLNDGPSCGMASFWTARTTLTPNGMLVDPPDKLEEALVLAEKGCSLNESNSCASAGQLVEARYKIAGNMANVDKGIEYYLKACKLGHQETCKMLDEMRKPR